MGKKNKIEEGDRVDVFFANEVSISDCEVLYTPCATGDSWHLKEKSGEIIYVQSFEMMRLKNKIGEQDAQTH